MKLIFKYSQGRSKTFHSSIALTTNDEEAAFGSALFAGVACQVIGMDEVKRMIKERESSGGFYEKEL